MRFKSPVLLFVLYAIVVPTAWAVDTGPDTAEAGSVEAIAEFTSETRFLSPWVAYVPESADVPSPTDYLGHLIGVPGELTHSDKIRGYVRELDEKSDRVHVETIGQSAEGKDIVLVVIGDEEGIASLDAIKNANAALADPRQTSPQQAEALIAQSRPAYYFNCNLHADETGSGEMCMELAYRLAVSEQPMIQGIREKLLVLINPVSEPDGRDRVVDWFYRYLKGKTDFTALPRQSPPYWSEYVYVDVNRDAHQKILPSTQAVSKMFFDYHPVVVHDLHEAIALLLSWNGTGPYNPNMDPIVTSRWLEMSFHEMTDLSSMGMPGVWTWNFGEGFGHHFLDSVAINHNAIGRGYETWGNATAETVTRQLEPDDVSREWYRPWPPETEFQWSMRDNVNYQQTAALSILDWSARHDKQLLRDFYQTGFNSWQKGVNEKPYAFVIPAEQADRSRVARMINRLRAQKIEVGKLQSGLKLQEGEFQAGDFIVMLDQPYRNFAIDVLEPQHFPENYEQLPYDDVSWAYPVGFDVAVTRIEDEGVRKARFELLLEDVRVAGEVQGNGPAWLLREQGQEALLAARYRLADFQVEISEQAFSEGSTEYPAGSWLISAGDGSNASQLADAVQQLSEELALDFTSVRRVPDVRKHLAELPRLGVWVPWADTDMMGWVRYVLDDHGVPYTYLRDEDLRAGGLKDKVDVILYGPFSRLELTGQIHGIAATEGPMPFESTAEFPNLGKPVPSSDITGGPGYAGLAELQKFVEQGGVLLTLGGGSTLALEGGLVRGVPRASSTNVFTPGAEIRASFDQPRHPIAYGYGTEVNVFRTNLPVYDTPRHWITMAYCTSCLTGPKDEGRVVMSWGGPGGDAGEMVISGGMRGADELAGRPAIIDSPVGQGHVITYNFNGIHRDMNRGDYRLVWNAILNWKNLGPE
ncbi:MAG TPA: M14 family zinc carboxypeptidase [Xanthomonadales bacterium]|nr:M14 family zinc carboxypeptidase [Xanthomonadales bacterium]